MSGVDRLFAEYVAEHRAGGKASPPEYLEQLEGVDREELAALIDAYLARSPGTEWDSAAYQGSSADALAERLSISLQGRSGLWPALLPRLRERARITRTDLTHRLATALGVVDREQKVAGYYHQMEQGLLRSDGVSTQVLTKLGEILNAKPEWLRQIGTTPGPAAAASNSTPAFARKTERDSLYLADSGDTVLDNLEVNVAWDEVDELFLRGD